MRCTAAGLIRCASAIVRTLHCVAPLGRAWRVASTTARILVSVSGRLTSTSRPIPLEPGQSLALKPTAPEQHCRSRQTQIVRDRVVGDTLGGTQHDLASPYQALLSRG